MSGIGDQQGEKLRACRSEYVKLNIGGKKLLQ